MSNIQQRTLTQRLRGYLSRHKQAIVNGLGQLSRSPMNSAATCMIIGIALALPTILFVLLKNAEVVTHNFQQSAQVVLYLKKDVSEDRVNSLMRNLRQNTNISSVHAISPAQGLKELQQQAGFEGMVQELQDNPLPWAVIVSPASRESTNIDALSKNLKALPEVDGVQLDVDWIKRLQSLVQVGRNSVEALAFFLGLAVLLIVNNSIHTATQNNHKEITVLQMLGGTNRFIRRPFLYVGMIYGLLGAIIAWYVVDILYLCIRGPIHKAAMLYSSQFQLMGLGLTDTLWLIAMSVGLGLVGAWVAVVRYMRL